ncbi:MAG: M1 family aminopeptidase, partial [Longimicrobiales bacterium]|nr:M1 family aminopeptidase [Longimicrobiales bacterium]
HMWYGNLVTMVWWNDLWLNEAFATWMAGKIVADLYPELRTGLRLRQNDAMPSDARPSTLLERVVLSRGLEAGVADGAPVLAEGALLGYIVEKRRRGEDALTLAAGDDRALLDFDARILLKYPSWARRAADAGVPLACWTVDSTADAEALVEMGVPRITTNRVGDLVRWRAARAQG